MRKLSLVFFTKGPNSTSGTETQPDFKVQTTATCWSTTYSLAAGLPLTMHSKTLQKLPVPHQGVHKGRLISDSVGDKENKGAKNKSNKAKLQDNIRISPGEASSF